MTRDDYLNEGFNEKYEPEQWEIDFENLYFEEEYDQVKKMYEKYWNEDTFNSLDELVKILEEGTPTYSKTPYFWNESINEWDKIVEYVTKARDLYQQEREKWEAIKRRKYLDLCSVIPDGESITFQNETFEG